MLKSSILSMNAKNRSVRAVFTAVRILALRTGDLSLPQGQTIGNDPEHSRITDQGDPGS
jgi:hypothetical protein